MPMQNALVLAVQNAVSDNADLDRVLARISRRIIDVAAPGRFPDMVEQVVDAAVRQNWIADFVKALLWLRPASAQLQAFRDAYPAVSPSRLRTNEFEDLRLGFSAAFRSSEELAPIIAGISEGEKFDAIIDRVDGSAPADYVERSIRWFDDRGALEMLIAAVKGLAHPVLIAKTRSVMTALKRREIVQGLRPIDPIDTCLIEGEIFIDRVALRDAIRAWLPAPLRPVVAVHGPSRSGNSYSLRLIAHVVSQRDGFELAAVDLGQEQHALYRPGHLARSIIYQLGLSKELEHMPTEQAAGSAPRWASELSDWLLGLARQEDKTWVIALDRFDHPDLPDDTRDMIRFLTLKAAATGSPIRVVLLAYRPEMLPKDIRNRISFEPLRQLNRDDLREFLKKLTDQQSIDLENGVLDQIAEEIVAKAPLEEIEAVAAESQRWFDGLAQLQPV
jgi:hypothetical protein